MTKFKLPFAGQPHIWIIAVISIVALVYGARAAESQTALKIFPSQTKASIEKKMAEQKWAGEMLLTAHESVDKYVAQHQSDTTWITSRLQMYWKNHYTQPYVNGGHYSRAEGSAPSPTVRFTGGRDWATDYNVPSLENIVPYMDYRDDEIYLQNRKKEGQPWEWVKSSETAHQIERINEIIMEKAMYSAFIYWLSGDESYAKFAYDIFMTYVDGIYYREAPIAEIDTRNARILGLTSFEVIHEKVLNYMPMCYDFLYSYIVEQDADIDRIHTVFQKFADQIIINGVSTNNWNIFQACFVTYLALILEDDEAYENGKGQQYYIDFLLNKSVEKQKALREVCDIYDQNTAMWNESPGYSTSTTKDLIEILWLMGGIPSKDSNSDIFEDFSIVERAALASFEYLLPNKTTTAFGDNGYATIDFAMYETLLAIYHRRNDVEKERVLMSVIRDQIAEGLYDRERGSSLYKLFTYVDEIDMEADEENNFFSTVFYTPNVNLTIQRNGMDEEQGLMVVNSGTGFNHGHSNGINLELYGKGYPLGVDKARGTSYWVADHAEYYSKTISHNTVLVDGVSDNTSPRQQPGEESVAHKMNSCFPECNQKDAADPYTLSYIDNQFLESTTVSDQRRLNGIVRTSPTSGYYVDIFRSRRQDGKDERHEYLYHNSGQSLTLFGEDGAALQLMKSSDLTSAGGKVKGYDYLTEKQEIAYSGDFKGTFELNMGAEKGDVRMDVWMEGEQGRKLFSVKTPRSLKGLGDDIPKEIGDMEIPAMIVRQSGEAWNRPFVAIFEPYTSAEGRSIESVSYFGAADPDLVGIKVVSQGGREEFIFNSTDESKLFDVKSIDAQSQAIYSVISKSGDKLNYLFMGQGRVLKSEGYEILTDGESATALVEWCSEGIKVKSDAPIELRIPKKSAPASLSYVDGKGQKQQIEGKSGRSEVIFSLPALDNVVLK